MGQYLEKYQLQQLKERQADGVKKLRWNSASEVRTSLARVNNLVLNGKISAKEANSIFYSANLILKALELEKK